MNEIITVGGVKYTATNVETGPGIISFMLPGLTVDEAEAAFKNAESLTVGSEAGTVYGEYPNIKYESLTKDADGNVSVMMSILTREQVQIRELQTSQGEQDEAIAGLLYGEGGGEAQ